MRKTIALLVAAAAAMALSVVAVRLARRSGVNLQTLVVLTPATETDIDAVRTGFASVHPEIGLEFVRCSAGECFARIAAEVSNPTADVMYSGLNESDGDRNASLFEPFVSSEPVPQGYAGNGFYNYDRISVVCFCINVGLEKSLGMEIRGYHDLLDPRLKGKVVISDPNSSSAAWNNMSNIFASFGYDSAASWDYIASLFANGLVVCQSSSMCFTAVERGEYAVGLMFEDGASVLLKGGADNVRIVYLEEGVSGFAFGSAIVRGAPHRKEAEVFVNWLQSADGQRYRSDVSGTSRFVTVGRLAKPRWIPQADELKWLVRDIPWLVENRERMIEKWNRLHSGRSLGRNALVEN